MIVGLGTGRTAAYAIRRIGAMVAGGMRLVAISTSNASSELAESLGIPVSTLEEHPVIDVTIDGADEVDRSLNLVKGRGGALLREKIVAASTREEIIVVDEGKMVDRLGDKEAIPVEVLRFGYLNTARHISALGCEASARMEGDRPFVTDNGNFIFDCRFPAIGDPLRLQEKINTIPGVVENGIFVGMAARVIVGRGSDVHILEKKKQ